MKTVLQKEVDKSLSRGWKMTKLLNRGGFFSGPTYDERTVYNRDDLYKLTKEGFILRENVGNIVLNILLKC